MSFDNPVVPPHELPKYAEVPLFPVEPVYKKVLFIAGAIWFAVIALSLTTLIYLIDELQKGWIFALISGIFVLSIGLTVASIQLGFKNKAWAIRERDIVFKKGWLFHKTHIIPFVKIQHCVVSSGPIERSYGLASLRLMTAASHHIDISVRGLKKETADQLKIWIMEKIESNASEGI